MEGITDSMNMHLSKLWEVVKDREVWHAEVHVDAKNQTQLSNQTTTMQTVKNRDSPPPFHTLSNRVKNCLPIQET